MHEHGRFRAVDDMAVRCTECKWEVDEFTAIAEGWRYYSDGRGDLMPFCPACARREFAVDAPASWCRSFLGELRHEMELKERSASRTHL
jgi:hypothetical protein